MGNSLRCCLACILPCGALDLIRVVHIDGNVDEYSRPVSAGEVLRANPNHILSRPRSQHGGATRVVMVLPESDLERGSIYFLIPDSSLPSKRVQMKNMTTTANIKVETPKGPESQGAAQRKRKSGRVGAWKQQLEIILEDQ